MGKGMRAGKIPKADKDLRKLERLVGRYAEQAEKRIVRTAKDSLTEEITEELMYRHNIDMIAVMLALRDEFSFGRSRLIRAVRRTAEHADRMILDRVDVDEMLQLLKDETGICEEDLTWEDDNG